MPSIEGQSDRMPLAGALAQLHERFRQAQQVSRIEPVSYAKRLAAIERQLQQIISQAQDLDPAAERHDVRTLLSDLQDWRQTCRQLDLNEPAEAAAVRIGELFQGMEASWYNAVGHLVDQPLDAEALFDALLQNTRLPFEAQRQPSLAAAARMDRYVAARDLLRDALVDCLQNSGVPWSTRERWETALSDHVDRVLTSVDDLPPDLAAAQLGQVADEVRWHLGHVEKQPGRLRRRLKRRLARARAETQERELQSRLETRLGTPFVRWSERIVLALIVLVVVLLTIEWVYPLSTRAIVVFNIIDAAACGVFLCEFFGKLYFVRGRWLWFRRHFLIDLIPSIPVGLLAAGLSTTTAANAIRTGRLARFLRLPRLVRYVRVLRPAMRVVRAVGLAIRGFDRLARGYGRILNRNVILYPTRDELELYEKSESDWQAVADQLRAELRYQWRHLLTTTDRHLLEVARHRDGVFQDSVQLVLADGIDLPPTQLGRARDIPARTLLEQLNALTPEVVETTLGQELVQQLARVVRVFATPPLRWLPIISSCVPRIRLSMSDSEIVAQAARQTSGWLKRYYDAWFWVADLYGTVTPSQFVDRLGSMLVKSSFRPAYRLALFGGFLLLTELALRVARFDTLQQLDVFLQRYVGTTVLVLGTICFLILALGWWLQRLAQEATEFYERCANACFLSLTEMIRSRHLQRDAELLYDRVLRAEWNRSGQAQTDRTSRVEQLSQRVQHALLQATLDNDNGSFPPREQVVMLYRDWLDGGLLISNDTRTVSQLLANPSLSQLLTHSHRVGRRQLKALSLLDLERQKSLFGGPYLWFNFVARSIAHSVAYLLVQYNRHAVPLDDLPQISESEQHRYQRWLLRQDAAKAPTSELDQRTTYLTSAFTALHFLDFDPSRDRDIERRFGTQVLQRLQEDRSLLIRKIFGTLPMHHRPRQNRVVNLYRIYVEWFSGGRALLLPVFLGLRMLKLAWVALVWLARAVQDVRYPQRRSSQRDAAQADFRTAVRKVGRIRDPIVYASLRIRMMMDPEYLGVSLPNSDVSALEGADVDVDMQFLRPEPRFREEVETLRQRAAADMQRLQRLIDEGLLQRLAADIGLPADALASEDHLRAAAVIYLADLDGVRSRLSAREILVDVFRAAETEPLWTERLSPRRLLYRRFRKYWAAHPGDARQRRLAWCAVLHNQDDVRAALNAWYQYGDRAQQEGERRLAKLLRHPGRISEQLVTLRTIQSFAVLDVLNYREHIHALGRYDETGMGIANLLDWRHTTDSSEDDG